MYITVVVVTVVVLLAIFIVIFSEKNEKNENNKELYVNAEGVSAQCVVINLDRNKDRLDRFMTEYETSDLAGEVPVKRLPAVDARKIDIHRYVTPKALNQIETTIATGFRLRHHEMTIGAVGCFLSHITVMRMLLQDDEHNIYIIFEDDAVIPRKIFKDLRNTVTTAPSDWDVILLGYHYATYNTAFNFDKFDRLSTFWGTHAVIINKTGALKIVHEYQNSLISKQIDSMMSVLMKNGDLKVYAPKHMIVSPGHFGSDIQVPVKPVAGIDPYDLDA